MKRRVCVVVGIVLGFSIMTGIMLSMKMTNKNVQDTEKIGKVEEIQEESHKQALEGEPQIPETWDLNKVTPVLSEDNIYVPVPKGWSISTSEDERYVNGNVTKKGSLSSLTFTSTGDYQWTQNANNIWVSGNKQQPNSISELISNEIEVGPNGGWVEVEWSVCSQSGYDVLYMYVNDTVNGTTEQLPKEITGTPYGTSENSLIYTKCGKELPQGKYTISIKYSKYNNTTHTGLDSGYVKSGTFINYDENGTDELAIHKTGGFVIYEGTEEITNLWTASKSRNQFVWVPVEDPSRIYEKNETTGKIKAKIWNFKATERTPWTKYQTDKDTKAEAGVLSAQNFDGINSMSDPSHGGMPGYSKDILYKELETVYKNTIKSIERYGGFYIGRYETGNIKSEKPVVRRMNSTIDDVNWYKMYERIKNVSNNPNVHTSMIWGSLWDETLQWLIDTGEKIQAEIATDSTNWGNYKNSFFQYYNSNGELTNTKLCSTSTRISTGSAEYAKANNIYDLAGNKLEYTLENYGVNKRYSRGGYLDNVGNSAPAGERKGWEPSGNINGVGFRTYFYIQ